MKTTTEAAALLDERGYKGNKGEKKGTGKLTADAVKRMCLRGLFPNARLEKRGGGRGFWLIPQEDLDLLFPPKE